MSQEMYIIRGLPGSGKSTLAKKLAANVHRRVSHVEADMFFENSDGTYKFIPELIQNAHAWCESEVARCLGEGDDVVVANTFSRHWEYASYIKMADEFGADVLIITCHGEWQNIHGVPDHVIQKMRDRWEY